MFLLLVDSYIILKGLLYINNTENILLFNKKCATHFTNLDTPLE